MKKELFRFINKTIQFAENKYTLKFLAIISFLESIIFPIPPDIFLIPISMTKKYRWFFLGIYTTFFSILGGIFGYLIGAFFWDYIGELKYTLNSNRCPNKRHTARRSGCYITLNYQNRGL